MPITLGVNVHTRPRSKIDSYAWAGPQRIVELVKSLGFTSLRVDCGPSMTRTESPSPVDRVVDIMNSAKAAGLTVQLCFTLPYGSNPTDGGAFADTPQGRYQQGRTLVTDTLLALPYQPVAIEIENEVPIKAGMVFTAGQTLTEYDTPVFGGWADLMRGEFDAIKSVMPGTKIIVGTTNRNYAFIPWIIARGINPDIVGYHLYERIGADLATWQGGSDWHQAMRAYGKPISVNELNGHQAETPVNVGIAGAKSLRDVLASPAAIESVYVYELFESDLSNHGICDCYGDGFIRKPAMMPLFNVVNGF